MRTAITHIGRLVTCADGGQISAEEDASLVLEDGYIVAVGRNLDLPDCAGVFDAKGRLVTPGLIDSHTHFIFAGNRSNEFEMRASGATYEEIASQGGGIRSTMKAVRSVPEDELTSLGMEHARQMLSHGTTMFESKTGYGLSLEDELKTLRAAHRVGKELGIPIYHTLLATHAVPPEFEGRRSDYVAHVLEVILPAARPFISAVDIFVESGYFTVDDAKCLSQAAKEHGLHLKLHVDQLTASGGAELAAELGARTADHLELTDVAGIEALKLSGVVPVFLPASVFCLGKTKYPDAKGMLEAGLPVVLATDFNPGSSPTPSLPFVMALACTHMGMSPAEALSACTMHAARCLDVDRDTGSLEVGKRADFVLWNLKHEREIPYWVGDSRVEETWVAGRRAFSKSAPSTSL